MSSKSIRKAFAAIALALAVVAVFTGPAVAGPTSPSSVIAEVQSDYSADWLTPRYEGVERPDGYLPRLQGIEPLAGLPNQSTRADGPTFMNGVPDGYVGSGIEASRGGVTPANLARAYEPGLEPVSASAGGVDRSEIAFGFGLGLVLATAGALLVLTRGRMRLAHS